MFYEHTIFNELQYELINHLSIEFSNIYVQGYISKGTIKIFVLQSRCVNFNRSTNKWDFAL